MKLFQLPNRAAAVDSSEARARELSFSSAIASAAPVQAVDDEADNTEKCAVPDEINGDSTPAPLAEPMTRRPPGRRMARTVASPIPAMLAESMALAEEPASPTVQPAPLPRKTAPAPRR